MPDCADCGNPNPAEAEHCHVCGQALAGPGVVEQPDGSQGRGRLWFWLALLGGPLGLPALLGLIVSVCALIGLRRHGHRHSGRGVWESTLIVSLLWSVIVPGGAAAYHRFRYQPLLKKLTGDNPEERRRAAAALDPLGRWLAERGIAPGLWVNDEGKREKSAAGLSALRRSAPLIRAAREGDDDLRPVAVAYLGHVPDLAAVEALAEARTDKVEAVSQGALGSLQQLAACEAPPVATAARDVLSKIAEPLRARAQQLEKKRKWGEASGVWDEFLAVVPDDSAAQSARDLCSKRAKGVEFTWHEIDGYGSGWITIRGEVKNHLPYPVRRVSGTGQVGCIWHGMTDIDLGDVLQGGTLGPDESRSFRVERRVPADPSCQAGLSMLFGPTYEEVR